LLVVQSGTLELHFNKATGMPEEIRRGAKSIPFSDGPRLLAFRRNERKYEFVAGPNLIKNFTFRQSGADVIVEASYEGALRHTRWQIGADGSVRLDYEYFFDGVVDMIGVQFDFPEKQIKRIRWLGRGPYRVWQNRMEGTRLDVWENAFNDSTPGESWIYPEFKGYFRDWRWAAFDTPDGRITVLTETPDSFLGLFKPKDGVNGLLDLPEIGIAFLEVIPAMRNKFHNTDEIGPQSKPKQVSGTVKRTVHFRFGD